MSRMWEIGIEILYDLGQKGNNTVIYSMKNNFYQLINHTIILNHQQDTFCELLELRKQAHHLFYVKPRLNW